VLVGTGSLWLDRTQVQAALRYSVTVVQVVMLRATGRIAIAPHDAGALVAGIGPNSDLVLVLEDGRRWPCTLKNSDGDLVGRGEVM
jgi:hypothetical protein